jgi:hypothetical protein
MARRIAGWALLLSIVAVSPAIGDEATVATRVRTSSPRVKALIEDGLRLSDTFRRLTTSLQETDGVVYVEDGECLRSLMACLEWRVTTAGDYRFLFVRIRADRPDDYVIASIGHELQHALEVLRHRYVTTRSDFAELYLPPTRWSVPSAVETRAAVNMGEDVLNELRRARSQSRVAR